MYFPYLRGRQYELLALRELVEGKRLGQYITPIIEPVKLSSTLIKTLELFIKSKYRVVVIHNPRVGSFSKDLKDEKNSVIKDKYDELFKNDLIIKGHILNAKSHSELRQLVSQGFNTEKILVQCDNRDYIDTYLEEFSSQLPSYVLIPDESVFRRNIKKNRILLEDKFEKQDRNVDYANIDNEPFSDDHLYFKDDGYVGFSDYSIVGNNFLEAGFAPYAVALHIIYFDKDNSLRIKHFVSDSNEDITNPAGKFYEALHKLNNWDKIRKMDTLGLRELLLHYKNETYPGLGTVKKLSMMHHIELVGQYLDGVE